MLRCTDLSANKKLHLQHTKWCKLLHRQQHKFYLLCRCFVILTEMNWQCRYCIGQDRSLAMLDMLRAAAHRSAMQLLRFCILSKVARKALVDFGSG